MDPLCASGTKEAPDLDLSKDEDGDNERVTARHTSTAPQADKGNSDAHLGSGETTKVPTSGSKAIVDNDGDDDDDDNGDVDNDTGGQFDDLEEDVTTSVKVRT